MKPVNVVILGIVLGLLPQNAMAADWWSETPDLNSVEAGVAETLAPAGLTPFAPAEWWAETPRLTGMNYGEPLDAAATVRIEQHVVPEMYAETPDLTAVSKAEPAETEHDLFTVAK